MGTPITDISFNWTTHRREAAGADNWPITWAADGNQYTHGGDGYGWTGTEDPKAGCFFVQISGDKDTYTGQDTYYSGSTTCGDLCGKSYGILAVNGVLYAWLAPNSNAENWDSQTLYKSTDNGVNWSSTGVQYLESDAVGAPTILQFGQDYANARDNYIYMYWTVIKDGTSWDIQSPGEILLSRVLKTEIETKASYEWLTSTDSSSPTWGTLANAQPVFTDADGLFRNSAIWQPTADRYILITESAVDDAGNIRMHEAPEPWGPWTTFYSVDGWPTGGEVTANTFFWNFSPKWWDGLNGVLVFTGKVDNDSWNTVECTLTANIPDPVKSKVGVFETTTQTAGNTVNVAEVGFQPKAVLFWWSGQTSAIDAITQENHNRGVGWATSTTSRYSVGNYYENLASPTVAGRRMTNEACIAMVDGSGTDQGSIDFQSFDLNGFTLVIDTQCSINMQISYLALGGDGLVNAAAGFKYETDNLADFTQVTGVGFQPNLVFISSNHSGSATIPHSGSDARFNFGFAASASPSDQHVISNREEAGEDPTAPIAYNDDTYCYFLPSTTTTAIGKISQFLTDGYEIEWKATEENNDQAWVWLALDVTYVAVGSLLTKTDTSDISITGLGFKPSSILFSSNGFAESTDNTQDSQNSITSIGAATSETERTAQGSFVEYNVSGPGVHTIIEHDAVYVRGNDSHTIDAIMDLKSIDTDGFTCIMDDVETSPRFVGYVAFGPHQSILSGTVSWGHDTGVQEENIRDFTGNWTGTGTIVSSGDDEAINLDVGEYMESETWNIGSGDVRIRLNVYATGDNATIYYKQGDSEANCEADTWHAYSSPFACSGWVKVKVEN